MTIQLIIDGGGDLPQGMMEDYNIHYVPLNLHFGNEQYKTGETIDLKTFYEKLKNTEELPRSSSPSPNDFYEKYKALDAEDEILVLSLTQGLSSTYESAVMGRDMLLEEEPNRKVAVLNTKTASSGIALLVDEAWKKINEGLEFEAVVSHMEERIEKTATLFILKTLENVIKGGRLDKVKGTIAKTLNIKLLMQASEEGTIEVTEKVRGNKKSIRRFVDQISEYTHQFENRNIALSHCNDEEGGQTVLNKIKERYNFKDGLFMEMGPLISTYAGEGGLVIAFFKD
ncbi:EDD domain protein, DegV family [Halobacillus karajensis]|uniref:Fatty acid-binding protein n=1 Tax=Halobacillus karajensis TaxID=195088 RepID=A0A024P927_9BACI|nr:DegV family protein [Halobacillus karajensis]CDQ21510.1 Fatty acid-binding protein [Halobacillus karajensis]CDQ25445.1 Fatty acid-binding protein [Halobacillus karajensis]CDQ29024.1 Fatty acid-binding protein [Halobacillus karajensis]SEI09374.1 EDD domain protein, DegV family [Halobacillus karajensis]